MNVTINGRVYRVDSYHDVLWCYAKYLDVIYPHLPQLAF